MIQSRAGRPKRIYPVWVIVCLDFTIFAAALVVFALFHHVLPRGMTQQAIDITARPDTLTTGRVTDTDSDITTNTSDATDADPQIQGNTAPGDFSSVFPIEDTGANAIHSYQTDAARVAVKKLKVGEAVCYVADIWVRDIHSLRAGLAQGRVGQGVTDNVLDLAQELSAVVAVNGDYYGARAKGVVIRNGVLYRDNTFEDVCVLYEDGVMETYSNAEFNINTAIERKAWQAWSFGPALLDNGKAKTQFNSSVVPTNPRTAIGYYEPGHYCLVVVDGRQQGYSLGLHLKELSAFFETLGCQAAYNLDGGQSSMMTFGDVLVNQPYNNGRPSSDIIYVMP
ncbi:exopolysaccharide biosynthesis protein [Clostridia bacterium]|nr:exopolysaccharide biosynthesis protein [Clostridia bacterium]